MKLEKVLFPEIFKGTRGPEFLVKFLRRLRPCFTFDEDMGLYLIDQSDPVLAPYTCDPNLGSMFSHALTHEKHRGVNYHICRDFMEALMQVGDREIPLSYLPENFLAYFSFPPGLLSDGEDQLNGAYVYCGKFQHHIPVLQDTVGDEMFLLIHPTFEARYMEDGAEVIPCFSRFMSRIMPGWTAENIYESVPKGSTDYVIGTLPSGPDKRSRDKQVEYIRTILNLILYINSEDPVLEKLTPVHGKSHRIRNQHTTPKGHRNECTVPIVAVNWDYTKLENRYEDGKTFIESFPRWQRCGEKFSKVKLVWVTAHERNVRRKKESEEDE